MYAMDLRIIVAKKNGSFTGENFGYVINTLSPENQC